VSRDFKQGIDYFPFDVGLLGDPKLRQPKQKHGSLATVIYLSALTIVYRDKGYYAPYKTNEERANFQWTIQSFLQGRYQPSTKTIAEVIEDLAACGLFTANRLSEIITSKRIQCEYYRITVERKSVVIDSKKWLLSLAEMQRISVKHSYFLELCRLPNNEDNRPINDDNRPNKEQKTGQETENETDMRSDGRTADREFYLDCIKMHVGRIDDEDIRNVYGVRFVKLAERLSESLSVKISGREVDTADVLNSFLDILRDSVHLTKCFGIIDSAKCKNKFNYSVSVFYNQANGF
jgi:hypothetical protein